MTQTILAPRAGESLRCRKVPCSLAAPLDFLGDPANYPGAISGIKVVETHLSWVFLTDRDAYKLKKPLRFDHNDLRTVAARKAHCLMEIRLNRRLADDVYLGAVALCLGADGRLAWGEAGEVAEWLIHMRRLPEGLMLDRMIQAHEARPRDVAAIAAVLARFYRVCSPEPLAAGEWPARFIARISENARELSTAPSPLVPAVVQELGQRQLDFLDRHGELLERRAEDGRIVEGHGDLRPEHICLESPPQIIDCLEFSRELRIVDVAEELGFLALECERLGAPGMKEMLLAAYARASGDDPPPCLVDFYQSHHACVRAKLAIRHLLDGREPDAAGDSMEKWRARAQQYLALATLHIDAAEAAA